MHKYILKRILMLIPVIFGVSLLVFCIMNVASGDVTAVMGAEELDAQQLYELKESLGLNDPLLVRYVKYMWNLITKGDLGTGYISKEPVMSLFLNRFPNTLKLALGSTLVCVILSIPLGIYSAVHHGSIADNVAMVGALLGLSIPNFWLGLVLIVIFALRLGWLPSEGAVGFKSIILPAITIGTGFMASMTRVTRSSMLDVIRSDYLRTARAKGAPERQVIYKHALKNALIPIITSIGETFATALGGAVVTEAVFSWPGVGRLIIDSIRSRDTMVVVGCIIMKTIVISVILLIVDILYAFVDPRIKSHYARARKAKIDE
ncbi:MAG: ABC transporter permease [Lachnospiraceae bacterium]|nr:ABC transporter permease [Lachnospiraceae bacterium]